MMEASAPPVQEKFQETPVQRLVREIGAFLSGLLRLILLAAILTPLLLFSFLTVDIPVYAFDRMFDAPLLKPSNWLNVGVLSLALMTPVAILITRRFGGDEAARAITASWGVSAVAAFAGLTHLAPSIEPSDLPSVRFVIAYVASAMAGQYLAVGIYDIARGGGPWWRAPLSAMLIGYAAHSAIYFPWVYWNLPAPWFNWMVSDFAAKALIAFSFMPFYRLLTRVVRPTGGYGGR